MKYLQNVPIHKDDLFFIPAGTIHAIGAGALVAEIQWKLEPTYRLYDYDRIERTGRKRERISTRRWMWQIFTAVQSRDSRCGF